MTVFTLEKFQATAVWSTPCPSLQRSHCCLPWPNCGLPGTAGFVGEWMVILGAVKFDFVVGMLAASALIFGAAYTLWMFKRVYLGPVTNDDVKELTDINAREFTVMALLAIAVLYMGLYPKPFTDVMEVSVANLLEHVAASKLP
jgi:NADH-quinone oxidoreductase subunit M